MTDKKITELTEATSVLDADVIPIVVDTTSVPITKKVSLSTLLSGLISGWVSAQETWTYASPTTIAVPTDATLKYSIGDKVRFQNNDSGTYLYAYIVTVAATLLTVIGDAVPNAVLTDNYFSKASTPLGFPQKFSWTPSWTSLTVVGTPTYTGFYTIIGNVLKFVSTVTATTSTACTVGVTNINNLPVSAARADVVYVSSNFVGNIGMGIVSTNVVFPPGWAASAHVFIISGCYQIT